MAGLLKPMLAHAMPEGMGLADFAEGWTLEEKFDGHRIMLRRAGPTLTVWSRNRQSNEPLLRTLPPALDAAARDLPDGVYDGEEYVPGGQSSDVTRKDRQHDLRLVLFDVVEILGRSIAGKPFTERRAALDLAVAHHTQHTATPLITVPTLAPVTLAAVKAIWDRNGEGAILKRGSSLYQVGRRSKDWIKVKKTGAIEGTITGFKAGKGGPYAITCVRCDDGLDTTVRTIDTATTTTIAAAPDTYIGRRLVISYTERTTSGRLRHGMWDHLLDVTATPTAPVDTMPRLGDTVLTKDGRTGTVTRVYEIRGKWRAAATFESEPGSRCARDFGPKYEQSNPVQSLTVVSRASATPAPVPSPAAPIATPPAPQAAPTAATVAPTKDPSKKHAHTYTETAPGMFTCARCGRTTTSTRMDAGRKAAETLRQKRSDRKINLTEAPPPDGLRHPISWSHK